MTKHGFQAVTANRNASDLFAFKWLRAPATTEIALTGITAKVLSDNGTSAEAPKVASRQRCSEPYPGLEVLCPDVCAWEEQGGR